MIEHPHVELAPDGQPIIKGTRVPVFRLYAWFLAGVSVETLIRRYPTLGGAKVLSALSFAIDNPELMTRERKRLADALTDLVGGPMLHEQLRLEEKK